MSTTVRVERGKGGGKLWARVLVSPPADSLGFSPGLAVAVIGWARAYLRAWAAGANVGQLPPAPPEVATEPQIWPHHVIWPILAVDADRVEQILIRLEPDLPALLEARPPLAAHEWRLPPIVDAPVLPTLSPAQLRRWQGAGVFTAEPVCDPVDLSVDPDGPTAERRRRA